MRHRVLLLAVCLAGTALSAAACSTGSSTPPAAAANPASITSSTADSSGSPAADPSSGSTASSTSSPGSGNAQVAVCSLMTSAQASSINGVTYGGTAETTPSTGLDTCTYHNTGKHVSPVDIQDLNVWVLSMAGCWASLQSADGPGTNITGLGDAAFGHSIGIDVKVGDRCVTVSGLTAAEFHNNYAPDVAMAKIILAGLS
jgi:hypothetical protein